MHPVFVYGTLKQGFRNHAVNGGLRRPGVFKTVQPLPLYIVGERFLPWLLNRPGLGSPVTGELYDCPASALEEMDRLEGLGKPGWYERQLVWVHLDHRPQAEADALPAWVYFGSEGGFAGAVCHCGPIPEYTQALASTLLAPP